MRGHTSTHPQPEIDLHGCVTRDVPRTRTASGAAVGCRQLRASVRGVIIDTNATRDQVIAVTARRRARARASPWGTRDASAYLHATGIPHAGSQRRRQWCRRTANRTRSVPTAARGSDPSLTRAPRGGAYDEPNQPRSTGAIPVVPPSDGAAAQQAVMAGRSTREAKLSQRSSERTRLSWPAGRGGTVRRSTRRSRRCGRHFARL